jgi:tight adherence protein C
MGAQDGPWIAFVCLVTYAGVSAALASGREVGVLRATRRNLRAPAIVARVMSGDSEARWREACAAELPELLDVLTLGLSSGLSFDMALGMYCARFDTELSRALRQASLRWQLGLASRAEALDDLATQMRSPAMGRFASTVSEALEFGSPLAQVLERQSESLRDEQRSEVEERIEKTPVKMLIPLGTLIVPAMMLSILGPLMAAATQVF